MIAPLMGAVMGLVSGAVFAGVLNLELFGYASQAAPRREGVAVMRWMMRSLLVLGPLAGAVIGYLQAEAILGSLV